jgi:hypothetical protein
MTTDPKPGSEPDPGDMSTSPETDRRTKNSPHTDPMIAEEEEAARLGDFA